jgi:hypothetical protein
LTMGFRPQLVVVSGLLVGIPLTLGFRPQLVVVSSLLVGIPLMVGFRLSWSLRLSRSPFHETFLPLLNSRLSLSPCHEFFPWWNLGYHGAPSQTYLSHNGVSAITKLLYKLFFHTMEFWPSRSLFTNFSFTRWNFGHHGAFLPTFLSHNGISAITESFSNFHEFFLTMEFTRHTILGKTLFIYITKSITKSIYMELPLHGKEYNLPYCNILEFPPGS